jgi:cytochrome P450
MAGIDRPRSEPETAGADMTMVFDYTSDRGDKPFDPPAHYEELRGKCPVSQITMWDGTKSWFLTRQADVRAALADELISADNRNAGFPLVSPGAETLTDENPTFARMDPPEQARQRAMVAADFTNRRIAGLRPKILEIVEGVADEMLAKPGPADLFTEFAQPIPSQVICLLLGVPYEHHEQVQRIGTTMIDHGVGEEALDANSEELTRFFSDLVASKAERPGDDLLSRLVVERERTGQLTRDDIIGMARVMLVAGFETTAAMIALGTAALFQHPDQLAALREEPGLIPNAVDELLRYLTIFQCGLPRVAVGDTEIGGQQIKAGEAVLCYLPSANRDPSWFEDPDALDVRRRNTGSVAFGFGPHRCIGQSLVKVEMEAAFETLLRRCPNLRLAVDFDQIRFRREMSIYGVSGLPVTW